MGFIVSFLVNLWLLLFPPFINHFAYSFFLFSCYLLGVSIAQHYLTYDDTFLLAQVHGVSIFSLHSGSL